MRLREVLIGLGHDCDSVLDEGLQGAVDSVVWQAAQTNKRFLITQDLDFSDIRIFSPGTHAGILLVRIPDDKQVNLVEYITAWLTTSEAESWTGCFIIGSPRRLRILRPK
ncbi:DUF5615 family PIN-like protein [bacterium]|nr:DUF5615 family PIN-like protein [bacterium]